MAINLNPERKVTSCKRILHGWNHFRYTAARTWSRTQVTITAKGREMLRLFSSSYASSSSANAPMFCPSNGRCARFLLFSDQCIVLGSNLSHYCPSPSFLLGLGNTGWVGLWKRSDKSHSSSPCSCTMSALPHSLSCQCRWLVSKFPPNLSPLPPWHRCYCWYRLPHRTCYCSSFYLYLWDVRCIFPCSFDSGWGQCHWRIWLVTTLRTM